MFIKASSNLKNLICGLLHKETLRLHMSIGMYISEIPDSFSEWIFRRSPFSNNDSVRFSGV